MCRTVTSPRYRLSGRGFRSRHGGFVASRSSCQGRRGPALDLPVQARTAPDLDTQATVVVVAPVPPRGCGVVPLDGWTPELVRLRLRDLKPESLRFADVGTLVDEDTEDQLTLGNAGRREEPQEEFDQPRIAVHEADPVASAVRLVFRAFAPVGDRSGDDDLAVAELADLADGCGTGCLSFGLPDGSFGLPVPADALRGPLAGFLVAEAWRAGQVPDPK